MSYVIGNNCFKEDGTQSYLVFQLIIRKFKLNTIIGVTDYVLSWQSKGLSANTIKPPATSDNSLKPTISYYHAWNIRVKLTKSCLKQDKVTFNHAKVVNIYISFMNWVLLVLAIAIPH